MTQDDFRKASNIDKEKIAIRYIVEEISKNTSFLSVVKMADGCRGLDYEIKPAYKAVIDLLKARTDELNKEMESL